MSEIEVTPVQPIEVTVTPPTASTIAVETTQATIALIAGTDHTSVEVQPASINLIIVGGENDGSDDSGNSGPTNELHTTPLTAAISLSALRVVTLDVNGKLIYADSRDLSHASAWLGLLENAVAADAEIAVLTDGYASDPFWNWSIGQAIFLGQDGTLTQTPPTTGFLRQVATVLTETKIHFEVQESILL